MIRRFDIDTWFVLCAAVMLAATTSHAQAPEARLSLERTVAAICAKADADGDSYRPFVCEPRCGCDPGMSDMDGCEETAPGEIEVSDEIALPARDALCVGLCLPYGTPCTHLGDCPIGEGECYFEFSNDPFVNCIDQALLCNDSADCAPGYSCSSGTCVSASTSFDCLGEGIDEGAWVRAPAQPAVCDSLPATTYLETRVTFSGIAPPDSPDVVTCSFFNSSPQVTLNANDALECIAQVEAAIGQPCTPYSP